MSIPELSRPLPPADFHRRRYELQVEASAQGKGVGRLLMELLQHVGKDWRMDKVMLTVFKSEHCFFDTSALH